MKNMLTNVGVGLAILVSLPLSLVGVGYYINWLISKDTHAMLYYAVIPLSVIVLLFLSYIVGYVVRRK